MVQESLKALFARVLEAMGRTARELSGCSVTSEEMVGLVARNRSYEDLGVSVRRIVKHCNGNAGNVLLASVQALVCASADKAWDVVGHIDDYNHRATAALTIASHTREEEHFADAEAIASHLTDDSLRQQAFDRIQQARITPVVIVDGLMREVQYFVSQMDFEQAFQRILHEASPSLKFRALTVLGNTLSKHI